IQNLQKGIQQFQANQQKMAQMEEANRIKEAQIYVQSAKAALNQKKFQQEMDEFDRKVMAQNREMDEYSAASNSWMNNIVNNNNLTQDNITNELDAWLRLTNSSLYGDEAKKRIEILRDKSQAIANSDIIKNGNAFNVKRNNGEGWDSIEELQQADPDGDLQRRFKIVKKQVNTADDGTPIYGWENTGEVNPSFMAKQRAKLERLKIKGDVNEVVSMIDDDDFLFAIQNDEDLRGRFEEISDNIKLRQDKSDDEGLRLEASFQDFGTGLTMKAKGRAEEVQTFLDEYESQMLGDDGLILPEEKTEAQKKLEDEVIKINQDIDRLATEGRGFFEAAKDFLPFGDDFDLNKLIDERIADRQEIIDRASKIGINIDKEIRDSKSTSKPIQPTEAVREVSKEGVDQMRSLLDNLR
ncbi:MAG: hypothetical protein ACXQTI_01180, partial [Candidatus Nezhaarchaeales archaeon]